MNFRTYSILRGLLIVIIINIFFILISYDYIIQSNNIFVLTTIIFSVLSIIPIIIIDRIITINKFKRNYKFFESGLTFFNVRDEREANLASDFFNKYILNIIIINVLLSYLYISYTTNYIYTNEFDINVSIPISWMYIVYIYDVNILIILVTNIIYKRKLD